jgi:hypothetical protein
VGHLGSSGTIWTDRRYLDRVLLNAYFPVGHSPGSPVSRQDPGMYFVGAGRRRPVNSAAGKVFHLGAGHAVLVVERPAEENRTRTAQSGPLGTRSPRTAA